MSNEDPFGPSPTSPQPVTSHDYSRSVVSTSGRSYYPGFGTTSVRDAPLLLWASASCYFLWVGYILWLVYRGYQRSHEINTMSMTFLILMLAIVIAFIVGMLKAQLWGLWGLRAVMVLGILIVVIPHLWPLTVLGLIGAGLSWIPSNKYWFGYR